MLFILRDAVGNLLTKDLLWASDCTVTELFRTPHKDVALNQLLEINAGDVELRAQIVACEVDNKNRPIITSSTVASNQASSDPQPAAQA
ncbi:MAG: hypothetical protein KUG71_10070 [Porticoccaceae bacterium]|nr:hypothetical protein [Porticoccaceae bacterium]